MPPLRSPCQNPRGVTCDTAEPARWHRLLSLDGFGRRWEDRGSLLCTRAARDWGWTTSLQIAHPSSVMLGQPQPLSGLSFLLRPLRVGLWLSRPFQPACAEASSF